MGKSCLKNKRCSLGRRPVFSFNSLIFSTPVSSTCAGPKFKITPNSAFPAPRCSTGGAVSPPRSTGSRPFPSQGRGSQSVAELIRSKIAGGTGVSLQGCAAGSGAPRDLWGCSPRAPAGRVRSAGARRRGPGPPPDASPRSVSHSLTHADPAAGAGSGERPRQGPLSGGSDAARGCRDLSEHAAGGRGLRSC